MRFRNLRKNLGRKQSKIDGPLGEPRWEFYKGLRLDEYQKYRQWKRCGGRRESSDNIIQRFITSTKMGVEEGGRILLKVCREYRQKNLVFDPIQRKDKFERFPKGKTNNRQVLKIFVIKLLSSLTPQKINGLRRVQGSCQGAGTNQELL